MIDNLDCPHRNHHLARLTRIDAIPVRRIENEVDI